MVAAARLDAGVKVKVLPSGDATGWVLKGRQTPLPVVNEMEPHGEPPLVVSVMLDPRAGWLKVMSKFELSATLVAATPGLVETTASAGSVVKPLVVPKALGSAPPDVSFRAVVI